MKFIELAREWRDVHATTVSDGAICAINQDLNDHLYPLIGHIDIIDITPKMMLDTLKKLEKVSTYRAGRMCGRCNEIFVYAGIMGYLNNNPAYGLKRYLKRHKYQHFAHLDSDADLALLLSEINRMKRISPGNNAAFWFLVYTAARRSEGVLAKRKEFDLESGIWTIPAERAKTRSKQIMPLSDQSLRLIKTEFDRIDSPWAFTSNHTVKGLKPIDPWSPLYLIRVAGYEKRQTMHGFRHIFSTRAHDASFLSDAIELSLSHSVKGTKGVYNHAKMIEQRRELMQWWADLVDEWRGLS
ncbi:tyrosine-type recombinase/integrase [Psychrobacter pygoscelis]|uniref:tyrosine-type recombinase/integrase n=1 Tax=Psychrobacter pygoscelis TaxID=2488563 RepID=UPI00103F9EDD|nr:site-specific integrase [Psychrobacter pygoscelis]